MLTKELYLVLCGVILVAGCNSDSVSPDAAISKDGKATIDLAQDTQASDAQPDTVSDVLIDTADLLQPDAPTDSQLDTLGSDGSTGCGAVTSVGCCKEQVLHWCDNDVLKIVGCAPELCGWDLLIDEYVCGAVGDFTAKDPSLTHPRDCPP